MTLHPSPYGSVDLPDFVESRPPRHRSDGVRIVRNPYPAIREARS